jgi:hypothetical protein
MLITFGTDGRASLPVPGNVRAIRFASSGNASLNVNWIGVSGSSQNFDLSQQTKQDVNIPKGQTGILLVTLKAGSEPVYCAWIVN